MKMTLVVKHYKPLPSFIMNDNENVTWRLYSSKTGVLASNSEKSVSQKNEQIGSAEVEGKISHVQTGKGMRLHLNQEEPPNMLT